MEKKDKKYISDDYPVFAKYIELTIKILEIIIVLSAIYVTYILLKDIVQGTSFDLNFLLLLMALIGSVYILLVLRDFFPPMPVDSNRITILITMVIFYFSLFAGIVVFKNNQPLPIIPQLPFGTVGLRSYGCGASFRNIEIHYLDSVNIWRKIPFEIVNDSTSWIPYSFKSYGKQEPFCRFPEAQDSLKIQLNNTGIILNTEKPQVSKYFNGAKYFKISTYVKFDTNFVSVDKQYEYPDVQICMNIPLQSEYENNEFYLGFSFPIENIDYAKFWIPLLEWRVGNQYRDSNSKLEDNEFSNNISLKTEYHLIGVSIHNSARFLLRNDNKDASSIICESRFEIKE